MRILVIEDEAAILEQLKTQLEAEGYMVDCSSDGEDGLFNAREYPIDAAIVDLGLPKLSGSEVIRTLREEGNSLPILVLTARGSWQDKVAGLEAGADDYLTKPFHFEELIARLRALLRRSSHAAATDQQHFGLLAVDYSKQQVSLHGNNIELTTFEYRLIEYLMRHAGEVISKAALADYLYPHDDDRDSNVIEVMVGRLRKKLDPDNQYSPIETMRGRGYRFTLDEDSK